MKLTHAEMAVWESNAEADAKAIRDMHETAIVKAQIRRLLRPPVMTADAYYARHEQQERPTRCELAIVCLILAALTVACGYWGAA